MFIRTGMRYSTCVFSIVLTTWKCFDFGVNEQQLQYQRTNCVFKIEKKYRFNFNMQSNHEVIRDQLHKWKILWTREKKTAKWQQHISCNYRKLINGIVKLVKLSLSHDSSWTLKLHARKKSVNLVQEERDGAKNSIPLDIEVEYTSCV